MISHRLDLRTFDTVVAMEQRDRRDRDSTGFDGEGLGSGMVT